MEKYQVKPSPFQSSDYIALTSEGEPTGYEVTPAPNFVDAYQVVMGEELLAEIVFNTVFQEHIVIIDDDSSDLAGFTSEHLTVLNTILVWLNEGGKEK